MADNIPNLKEAVRAAVTAGIKRGGFYTNEFLRNKGISDIFTKALIDANYITTITPEGYTLAQIESLAPTAQEAINKYLELRSSGKLKSTFGEPVQKDIFNATFDPGTVVTTTPTSTTQMGFIPGFSTTADMGFGDTTSTLLSSPTLTSEQEQQRKSAYDLLYEQFAQYGLQALVTPLESLIKEGVSPSEFTIRLRDTDAYKKRFAANAARVQKGLRALSEAEYIGLEDQYQNVMRNYGLPASYYTKGEMGVQPGFEKFLAGDVSAAELEDRIQTAQNRVINAAPQVAQTLRQFYPDITNGDILAYTLDPEQALANIKRKVTAAEIGAGAMQAGLATGLTRAEELAKYGVTGEQARQGYANIAEFLPSAMKLGDIYTKQGLGPYTQTTAEQEMFGIAGAAESATKRKKLVQLEQAQFGGSAGTATSALARERAGQF